MKAVIIDTFNYYELRTKYIYEKLKNLGYDVTFLVSDFDHLSKCKIEEHRQDTIFLQTKPYYKNISISRIKSHLDFSKKVYKKLWEINPDLIYCLIPVNSLAKRVHQYKKKHKQAKVIFDIYDLWPESLPVSSFIKKILFPWQNFRDAHLKCADKIFLECSYYKEFLPKKLNYTVAYICKERRNVDYEFDDSELRFLYLGSINNIIDINGIVDFLKKIQSKRRVRLIIIGGGESENILLSKLNTDEIPFTNYGKIFDEEEKDKIIATCQFGINMYKKGLSIGLTMKSLDYFSRGLPIVNRYIYDTSLIVKKYNCGFEYEEDVDFFADLNEEKWLSLRKGVEMAYENNFSIEKYKGILNENCFKIVV